VRSFYAAQKFAAMKLELVVTVLQTVIRQSGAGRWRRRVLSATVKAQARWRGVLARRMFREMKIEV
jgi:hypothetical protein